MVVNTYLAAITLTDIWNKLVEIWYKLGDILDQFIDSLDKSMNWFDGVFSVIQKVNTLIGHFFNAIWTFFQLALSSVGIPANLQMYTFGILGAAIVGTVAFGVIKMILAR